MAKERIGSLAWLHKRIEQADVDLLREMVKTIAETLMSAKDGVLVEQTPIHHLMNVSNERPYNRL